MSGGFSQRWALARTAMTEPVYLLISEDSWSMMLIESFLKFISARYGVTATYVQAWDDKEYATDSEINPFFGMHNFNEDVLRVLDYGEKLRISAGGQPYGE